MGIIFVERRAMGIGQGDSHLVVFRLEPHADTGQRAAGADSARKAVDLAVHLFPDFFRRRLDMGAAVGDIVKLIGPDGTFCFFRQTARGVHEMRGIRIRCSRHGNQLGAQRAQSIHFLAALGFRHDDGRFIALGIGDQRDPDPGVAGGPLDNPTAGLEQPAFLGILNDIERGAVFYRRAGIGKFALAVNVAARRFARAGKTDERGVANQGEAIRCDGHNRLIGTEVGCGKKRLLVG